MQLKNIADIKSEDHLQAECFKWFNNTYYIFEMGVLFHIPNGKKRSKRDAAILKAMGVLPGVPDLQLMYNEKSIFFELKFQDGTLSPDQIKIHRRLRNQGFAVYEIREVEEFKKIVEGIIK